MTEDYCSNWKATDMLTQEDWVRLASQSYIVRKGSKGNKKEEARKMTGRCMRCGAPSEETMDISEEDRRKIDKMIEDAPFPVSFDLMAKWYFGHPKALLTKEQIEGKDMSSCKYYSNIECKKMHECKDCEMQAIHEMHEKDDLEYMKAGAMKGKSEAIWEIALLMDEYNPHWTAEDLWSTLYGISTRHMTAGQIQRMRHFDTEIRYFLKDVFKEKAVE